MEPVPVDLFLDTEAHLADILAHEKTDRSELIRRLINERWLSLQAGQTLVERMGGHPKHLLEGAEPNLSERPNRKKAIALHPQKHAKCETEKEATKL